jgi:hypothetical protein
LGSERGDVPAGDVEPGKAGEEGHDERDPARGGTGGVGRRRLLGAAVLAPHGAGQRLHCGGRSPALGSGFLSGSSAADSSAFCAVNGND